MATSKKNSVFDELLVQREDYLNSIELVAECETQKTPMSRKSIHNYIKDGLLPKPVHQGKEALFHKEFVLGEIKAIFLLKSLFHVTYKDMKLLAQNKHVNFRDIFSSIRTIVNHLHVNSSHKYKERPLLVHLANDSVCQSVVAQLLDEIKKGVNLRKMDTQKFIFNALDKE